MPAGQQHVPGEEDRQVDDGPYRRGGDAGERRGQFAVAVGRLDQWGTAEDEQERMARR